MEIEKLFKLESPERLAGQIEILNFMINESEVAMEDWPKKYRAGVEKFLHSWLAPFFLARLKLLENMAEIDPVAKESLESIY